MPDFAAALGRSTQTPIPLWADLVWPWGGLDRSTQTPTLVLAVFSMTLIKFGLVNPNPYPSVGDLCMTLRRFGSVNPNFLPEREQIVNGP